MTNKKHITIIGAGMGGCLMAIYLAQKKFIVEIYESRSKDFINQSIISNRSINQSLSVKGIKALKEVKLWNKIQKLTLQEKGRIIHQIDNELLYQPYGDKQKFTEWSINRNDLNKALLTELQKYPNVSVNFDSKCLHIDFDNKKIHIKNTKLNKITIKKIHVLIGADGIHSVVRNALQKKKYTEAKLEYLDWGYKNIYIPAPKKGTLPFKQNAFHLWSRNKCAIFGIPNKKGFFTCTLTLPLRGKNSFNTIKSKISLLRFFRKYFPDIYPFIHPEAEEFIKSIPTPFTTLYTSKWHFKDFVVLLGDACHAVTIFYGQGINAAFEDCLVLSKSLEKYYPDYEKAFSAYEALRKPNLYVLADLCKKRFIELKDKYECPTFIARSTIEMKLESLLPNKFHSLYTLIVHTTLSYSAALRRYHFEKKIQRLLGIEVIIFLYTYYYNLKKTKLLRVR